MEKARRPRQDFEGKYTMPRKRYLENGGQQMLAINGIDGNPLWTSSFKIVEKLGEGYAGQVYKVLDQETETPYALKILRPESNVKEHARNVLFRGAFGADFAPAINEPAVRHGLIWQTLFKRGAKVLFDNEAMIPTPKGYTFIPEFNAFAELHEFIEGKTALPGDKRKNQRKRQFMDNAVSLATQMGAYQVARQYEWWTMLAGANVMEREDESLVAVDWRSGIALPFFIPLSPGDIPIIINNLKKGHFVNFDYADFTTLDQFVKAHEEAFTDLLPFVAELKNLDQQYRQTMQQATVQFLQEEYSLDPEIANNLVKSKNVYRAYMFNDTLPGGALLHQLLYSSVYQEHLQKMITDKQYRDSWLSLGKDEDLKNWQRTDRITPNKADELTQKQWLYMLHKIFFSHMPRVIQKATDNQELQNIAKELTLPIRISRDPKLQVEWMHGLIDEGIQLKLIDTSQAEKLKLQATDEQMRKYIVELAAVIPLIEAITFPVSATGVYILTGDPVLAAAIFASPISPPGVARGVYVATRLAQEVPKARRDKNYRLVAARTAGTAIAPISKIGTLFVAAQMAISHAEMANFLASYFGIKVARKIPVYGVGGGTLEHYVTAASHKALAFSESVNKKITKIFDRENHKQEDE